MNIRLAFYDLFSYAVPGTLYLYLFLDWYKLLAGTPYNIDLGNIGHIIVAGIVSFLLGLLANPISRTFWHKVYRFRKKKMEEEVFEVIKQRYPQIVFNLQANQHAVLFAHLNREHFEYANLIDRSKAISILSSNIGFALLLLGITRAFLYFTQGLSSVMLIFTILCFVGWLLSMYLGVRFDRWYYMNIFEYAISKELPISELIELKLKKQSKAKRM